MLAALYVGNGTFRLEQRQARPPGPGEVRLDVAYVGICGTDLHIKRGAMDGRVAIPAVIGHEMSGTVAAAGKGVSAWSPGDRVTVMPLDSSSFWPPRSRLPGSNSNVRPSVVTALTTLRAARSKQYRRPRPSDSERVEDCSADCAGIQEQGDRHATWHDGAGNQELSAQRL